PQAIRLALISPQAIQGRLPAGWSPLAAVDFRFLNATGNPLKKPCALFVGKKSYWAIDDPYALMLVRWDEEIYRWVSVKHMSLKVDALRSTVDRPGQYVFVIQDPRPVLIYPNVGEPLPVLPDCTLSLPVNSVTNSDLKFTPSEIYPGQTTTAVWTINPPEGGTFSSGVKVQANVSERYELLSGAEAGFTPYIADLTIYNNGSTTGSVEFSVSPNSKISLAELKIGSIKTGLGSYLAGGMGMVVGAEGGTVTGEGGAEVLFEAGSVSSPIAVTVKKGELSGLSLQEPDGFESVGVVELSLGGALLLKPAVISFGLTQEELNSLSAEDQLYIVKLEKINYSLEWVLTDICKVENSRIGSFAGSNPNPGSLFFQGVDQGGTYLFIKALSDIGYLTGDITLEGTKVTEATIALNPETSNSSHLIKSFTGGPGGQFFKRAPLVAEGKYLQLAFTGTAGLIAKNLATNDTGTGSVEIDNKGDIVTLDINITKSGPQILGACPRIDTSKVLIRAVLLNLNDFSLFSKVARNL
ncbi:MAG: hypothetical protein GY820_24390, partial [Gammaproteobacteria bacterium]|nr:hypothetical protein [Gammaproteobacteria bacterium]